MPYTIFIVDDDRDLVYILKAALEINGFIVISAFDGQIALNMLRNNTPDLMIVDLTMPGLDGWRFTMKVRQDKKFEKTPIIVCSGLLEEEKPAQAHESANLYLPKPFDIMELISKIKQFLHV